jgi:hypothetical protein
LGVYLPDKAPIFLRPFFPSIHLFGRIKVIAIDRCFRV